MNKSTRTCTFPECDRKHYARGLCEGHYRQHTGGKELRPLRSEPLEQRFWRKVNKDARNGCWEWTASKNPKGYGHFSHKGRLLAAHRVSWELANGPIPEGMVIDHRCANKSCVNPDHLRVITNAQNQQHLTSARKSSKSGIRGVCWSKKENAWQVKVGLNGRHYWGGYYASLEEAAAAVKALRAKLHTHDDHNEWLKRNA